MRTFEQNLGKRLHDKRHLNDALTLLVLDLGLDIVNSVRRLHLKGDSLARDCETNKPGPDQRDNTD